MALLCLSSYMTPDLQEKHAVDKHQNTANWTASAMAVWN